MQGKDIIETGFYLVLNLQLCLSCLVIQISQFDLGLAVFAPGLPLEQGHSELYAILVVVLKQRLCKKLIDAVPFVEKIIIQIKCWQQTLKFCFLLHFQYVLFKVQGHQFGMGLHCLSNGISQHRQRIFLDQHKVPGRIWHHIIRQFIRCCIIFPQEIAQLKALALQLKPGLRLHGLKTLQLRQCLCGINGRPVSGCIGPFYKFKSLGIVVGGFCQDGVYLVCCRPFPIGIHRIIQEICNQLQLILSAHLNKQLRLLHGSPPFIKQQSF